MKRLQKKTRMPAWAKKPKGERLKGSASNSFLRIERLDLLKRARGKGGIGGMRRNLITYNELFAIDFKARIGKKVAALQRRRKPTQVAVLGLGEGEGIAIREIKRAFGKKVFVCVLDVARRIKEQVVDEVRVGDWDKFPNERFGRKFHFIFSIFGPTYYSPTPLHAIEKAIALLEKGGEFFFQLDKKNVPYEESVMELAGKTGCTYRHAETGNYYSFAIRKK